MFLFDSEGEFFVPIRIYVAFGIDLCCEFPIRVQPGNDVGFHGFGDSGEVLGGDEGDLEEVGGGGRWWFGCGAFHCAAVSRRRGLVVLLDVEEGDRWWLGNWLVFIMGHWNQSMEDMNSCKFLPF